MGCSSNPKNAAAAMSVAQATGLQGAREHGATQLQCPTASSLARGGPNRLCSSEIIK